MKSRLPAFDLAIKKQIVMQIKLTALIFSIACLQVGANGYSQTLTLSLKDVPLEKAFKEIKKQTGYRFIYFKEQIGKAKNISL